MSHGYPSAPGFGNAPFGGTPGWSQGGAWPQGGGHQPQGGQFPGQLPGAGLPGGQFPGSPRGRKRSPLPLILGGLAVVVLAMVGLGLYSVLGGPDYQNDDYVPPPPGDVKPFPDFRVSEAETLLTQHAIYGEQLATPIRCELSNPDMDMATATDEEVKAYIDELMACNMRVWDQPFRGTGTYELVRPVVNIYRESVTSPCGGGAKEPNAFYCSANQQVYFSRDLDKIHPALAVINQPHVVDGIMAHEFAHGMQARLLVLQSFAYRANQSDRRAAFELQRRVELQADCFAGMYVQAVATSSEYTSEDVNNIIESMRAVGDDNLANRPDDPGIVGNHGHGASRVYWHQVGLTSTDIGACNTFVAPAEHVR